MIDEQVLSLDTEGKFAPTAQQIADECVAVFGARGTGKSTTVLDLLNLIMPNMPVVIVDTHGEYTAIGRHLGIPIVGRSHNVDFETQPEQMAALAEYCFNNRKSLIIDLRLVTNYDERIEYVFNFMARLFDLSKQAITPRPFGIVLEEAQNYVPQEMKRGSPTKALNKMIEIALEGRKFGLSIIISAQRPALISTDIRGMCALVFMHAVYIKPDFDAYSGMSPYSSEVIKQKCLSLQTGQAIVRYKNVTDIYQMRLSQFALYGVTPTLVEASAALNAIDGQMFNSLKELLEISDDRSEANLFQTTPITIAKKSGVSVVDDSDMLVALQERSRLEHDLQDARQYNDLLARQLEEQGTFILGERSVWETERQNYQTKIANAVEMLTTASQYYGKVLPEYSTVEATNPTQQTKQAAEPSEIPVEQQTDDSDNYITPMQTKHAIRRQELKLEGLIADLRTAPTFQQRALHWLTVRENGRWFSARDICRYVGISYDYFHDRPPLAFVKLGVLNRDGRGLKAVYKSALDDYLAREFPDLTYEKIRERVLNSLPDL